MSKYDNIRPYNDDEINGAICSIIDHPMLKAIMDFSFPTIADDVWKDQLKQITSIDDFQIQFIYKVLGIVLSKSSDGLTNSGFDKLDKNKPYLFISNHRDIILDTSLLNVCLHDNEMMLTYSAVGDNLVTNPFMLELAKLNRNFLVLRGLSPREMLQSSAAMSDYMRYLVTERKRSVWIAQREGRTKDGNDATHTGVLKMLAMAAQGESFAEYFKKLNIVPVSLSYENDPTDRLKIPELLAKTNNQDYKKSDNEDFNSVLNGIIGQKKRIHIHAGEPIQLELDEIVAEYGNNNKQIQALAKVIDSSIITNFRLWSSNYIAYDLLHECDMYQDKYTEKEKEAFVSRMNTRIDSSDAFAVQLFLGMYANPVKNKEEIKKK